MKTTKVDTRKIETQSKEFDAMEELSKQWKRVQNTPIVDDEYPSIRAGYERALLAFIDALRDNDRFRATVFSPPCLVTMDDISVVNFDRATRWHEKGLSEWSVSDWAVALAGEVGELADAFSMLAVVSKAGELCNLVKKLNRARDGITGAKDPSVAVLKEKVENEIGDVYLYLDLLAQRIDANLYRCVARTFNRVSVREGFPERLPE